MVRRLAIALLGSLFFAVPAFGQMPAPGPTTITSPAPPTTSASDDSAARPRPVIPPAC